MVEFPTDLMLGGGDRDSPIESLDRGLRGLIWGVYMTQLNRLQRLAEFSARNGYGFYV
jgi:hypothetical protein